MKLIVAVLLAGTASSASASSSADADASSASRAKVRTAIEGAVKDEKKKSHHCVVSPTLTSGGSGAPLDRTPPAQISGDIALESGGDCPSEEKKRAVVTPVGR